MTEQQKSQAIAYHQAFPHGKLSIVPSKRCESDKDLALAYTPGVAEPSLAIQKEPALAYELTGKGNTVAVVTNGTAVLGLGDVGPAAAKPVMEGKAVLFKRFALIDAVDIELDAPTVDEVVDSVRRISPGFGGINLEDIRSPDCFAIEERLKDRVDIPVFHDDQHGTAIVVVAALLNVLKLSGKNFENLSIVINGAGAAAIATAKFLKHFGVTSEQITMCDLDGVIYEGRGSFEREPHKLEFATKTKARTLDDAMKGADIFIGVSAADVLTRDHLSKMAMLPAVFALANPRSEIEYAIARQIRPDAFVATGRSDKPNQINNVLAFPYVFRAALDVRAKTINFPMMEAAARTIASLAESDGLRLGPGATEIIPNPFDPRLFFEVSMAVAEEAIAEGVAQRPIAMPDYYAELRKRQRYENEGTENLS